MKISKVIEKLNSIKEKEGDIEVLGKFQEKGEFSWIYIEPLFFIRDFSTDCYFKTLSLEERTQYFKNKKYIERFIEF
jgi:hypothetical protein